MLLYEHLYLYLEFLMNVHELMGIMTGRVTVV
jgi:hypothetical protein